MKTNRSLNSSPEGLQAISVLVGQLKEAQKKTADLLELRTEGGVIYLRPSGWQRFWLQRAFRHFHVLPPQLLGRRNQQRIADLLETSVVRPEQPVPSSDIFGVVAQVHSKAPLDVAPAGKVTVAPAPKLALVTANRPVQVLPKVAMTPVKPTGFVLQDDGLLQWIVAGVAAAAAIPLIMVSVYGISTLSSKPDVSSGPVATSVQPAAAKPSPAAAADLAPAFVPLPEKHRRRLISEGAGPALMQASATPAMVATVPKRRFVAELPPGHFAHPNMTGSLAGEVRLKATIGQDGSVKQVTVLSGDPRLAQAAMRAVMRWHYNPYGDPMPAETEIRMRFFGTDGVSIASVAGPAL